MAPQPGPSQLQGGKSKAESLTLLWGLPSRRGLTRGHVLTRSGTSAPLHPISGDAHQPRLPFRGLQGQCSSGTVTSGSFPLQPSQAPTSLVCLNVHTENSRAGPGKGPRLRRCRRRPGFTLEAGEERGEPPAPGEGTLSPAAGSSRGGGSGSGGLEKAVAAGPMTCGVTGEPLPVLSHGVLPASRLPY